MKYDMPLVCICIPTFNASKTIYETVNSILSQNYKNIIIHISDNASTDNTIEIIKSFNDQRITIHSNQENIGGEGNFTRCIQLAEGKYTAIFHADDIYHPSMVSRQVAFLESNPNVCAVFTAATTIDEHGKTHHTIGTPPNCSKEKYTVFNFKKLLQGMLLHHNFLVCPSAMVRTETYKNVITTWGNALFNSASDIDTWLRLAESNPIAIINEPLMQYRISDLQFSNKIRNRTAKADFFYVIDHYLKKPSVIKHLTKQDFKHYGWLIRHENVALAINLLKTGKITQAKYLLKDLFSVDAIHAAIYSRRGFMTFATGNFLQLMILLNLSNKSANLIHKIKKITRI